MPNKFFATTSLFSLFFCSFFFYRWRAGWQTINRF